jgi:ATP-dependent DNA ligase
MAEGLPFEERIRLLPAVVPQGHVFALCPTVIVSTWGDIERWLNTWLSAGHEGLVLKRKSGLYQVGQVGPVVADWMIKIKP